MLTKVWTEQRKRFNKFTSTDGVQTKKKAIKITAISNVIMTSIEKKDLFKTHFQSNDQEKVKKYSLQQQAEQNQSVS